MDWNWLTAICGVVCAILLIGKLFFFFRGTPTPVFLLMAVMPATILAVIYGLAWVGRLAAILCLALGAGIYIYYNSATAQSLPQDRLLRLPQAACATAGGALLLIFPFPPASATAQSAWFLVGFCALVVVAVGIGLRRGQVRTPSPGSEPDRLSPVSMVLDVLGFVICVAFLLCVKVWPRAAVGFWVILAWLAIFVLSFLSQFVFWYLPSRPRQRYLLSTVWTGMAFVMLGFALGAEPATPQEKAGSLLVIGVGFGIMLFMTVMMPYVTGAYGLPQAVSSWVRRRLRPEEAAEG